jgi:hypothetical protein
LFEHAVETVRNAIEKPTPQSVLAMALVVAGLLTVEWATGAFFTFQLQQRVDILKDLNELAQSGVMQRPELASIYQELLGKVAIYRPQPLIVEPEAVLRFVVAAFPWIWLSFYFPFTKSKIDMRWGLFVISVVLAGLFGWVGIVLPTFGSPLWNLLVYLIANAAWITMIVKSGPAVVR